MANKVIDGQSFSFNDLVKTGTITPSDAGVSYTGSVYQIGNLVFISALFTFSAGYQVSHQLATISGVDVPLVTPAQVYATVDGNVGGATIVGNLLFASTTTPDPDATQAFVSGVYATA